MLDEMVHLFEHYIATVKSWNEPSNIYDFNEPKAT